MKESEAQKKLALGRERIALRGELASVRVDHARAVRRVYQLETMPRNPFAELAGAIGGGVPHEMYLAWARARRDTALATMRYLEDRLGSVDVNDS